MLNARLTLPAVTFAASVMDAMDGANASPGIDASARVREHLAPEMKARLSHPIVFDARSLFEPGLAGAA